MPVAYISKKANGIVMRTEVLRCAVSELVQYWAAYSCNEDETGFVRGISLLEQ